MARKQEKKTTLFPFKNEQRRKRKRIVCWLHESPTCLWLGQQIQVIVYNRHAKWRCIRIIIVMFLFGKKNSCSNLFLFVTLILYLIYLNHTPPLKTLKLLPPFIFISFYFSATLSVYFDSLDLHNIERFRWERRKKLLNEREE